MSRAARDARSEFFDRAEEHTPYLATAASGALFLVKTADQGVGRSLFAKQGRGEHMVLSRAVGSIRGLLGPDAISQRAFVDVGANIGTTTIPAVVTHGFESAVAIEPEPENVRVLRLNIVLNDLQDRVRALPAAASNEVGHSDLVVHEYRGGKHWIATDRRKLERKGVPESALLRVQTITLDYLVEGGVIDPDRTGLLWMDAEGHEGYVVAGASELLERGTPIVMEFNPAHLDTTGGRERIQEAITDSYTHFATMHRSSDPENPGFALQPVGSMPEFGERFLDSAYTSNKTDILVLRLERDQAEGVDDLGQVFRAARTASATADDEETAAVVE